MFRIFSVLAYSTTNSGCSQPFLVNVDRNKPVLTTQDYEPQKCEMPTCGESLSAKWFVLSREACRLRDIRRDMVARERKQSESPSLCPLWTDSSQFDPLCSLLKNSARRRFDMRSIRDVFIRLHFRFYSWAWWKFGRLGIGWLKKRRPDENDFPFRPRSKESKKESSRHLKHNDFSNLLEL